MQRTGTSILFDRKNPQFVTHFNTKIAIEKRLSKARLREFLTSRYKELLA